ncbi:6-phosphofructokinase [Coprococcus eutactus]|uniref:Pyrophosphate--fructose 6-phosphate 1-phosphotransferase n=1 Tax=Coprococcus eutactus TaxID=33043 RepID=A0A412ISW9_9FIRM|nr:6-phosphofructokinase [Coprococcus eutactus]RGS43207.1 6-phosphofructokinase [Coprococcus eutactus]
MKDNCIVAQSGGPTVAINASLAGVIDGVKKSKKFTRVYGAIHGIQGVLENNFIDLSLMALSKFPLVNTLELSPAMYLGSCRYKLPDFEVDPKPYEIIFDRFEEYQVAAFFYIGGNDSMDTVDKLSKYAKKIGSDVKIVGIPKTIDNDLCLTDHTPGFGSAAKYVASTMLEIAHDTYIYHIPSVVIVEIMGRDAGWLTAASCLARNDYSLAPHLIYLPEVDFDENQFIEDIKNVLKTSRCVIIAVSEGIHDKDGNYISATSAVADKFGHAQLSGTGKALESLVKDRMDIKVRSIELNVLQRCAAHISSRTDINESFALGQAAVKYAAEGMTAVMSTIKRVSNDPYQWIIEPENVALIANQAKTIPLEWITPEKNDVTPEMEAYLRPLIIGEVSLQYKDGLPMYLPVNHLL